MELSISTYLNYLLFFKAPFSILLERSNFSPKIPLLFFQYLFAAILLNKLANIYIYVLINPSRE